MVDLRGALLAAAEEAEKMQQESEERQKRIEYLEVRIVEQSSRIDNLESQVQFIESENNKLRKKLKSVADTMRTTTNILLED